MAYKVEKFGNHRERRSFSKTTNRYELIPLEDHSIQPVNTYLPSWNPIKATTSWNWTGDEDRGFSIDQGPTSPMIFAFMKVKEEYRGKF